MPNNSDAGDMFDTASAADQTTTSTTPEYYSRSFASVLEKSVGYFIYCEFLVGNALVDKWGLLHSVGMNFVTLYEPDNNQYIVCDLYSLKFVTIYQSKTRPPQFRNRSNPSHQNWK